MGLWYIPVPVPASSMSYGAYVEDWTGCIRRIPAQMSCAYCSAGCTWSKIAISRLSGFEKHTARLSMLKMMHLAARSGFPSLPSQSVYLDHKSYLTACRGCMFNAVGRALSGRWRKTRNSCIDPMSLSGFWFEMLRGRRSGGWSFSIDVTNQSVGCINGGSPGSVFECICFLLSLLVDCGTLCISWTFRLSHYTPQNKGRINIPGNVYELWRQYW